MLHTFALCDRPHLSFCMPLFESALWFSSSSELRSLEISFSNIIRKIWSLPRCCHTAPLHLVAGIPSIFNTVLTRSHQFITSALKCAPPIAVDVFSDCINLIYTSSGYNLHFGWRFWKHYSDQDIHIAKFLVDVKLVPDLNAHVKNELTFICCN